MPLKIQIALSRKLGEPNYGSRGATVGLEMEADSNLVQQPREFHNQIARLFLLAEESVDRQLEGGNSTLCSASANGQAAIRIATPAQIRALYAIAKDRQLDLVVELRERFAVDRPDDLTVDQASRLIDLIRQPPNGIADPA